MDDDEIIEFLLWALATAPSEDKATRHWGRAENCSGHRSTIDWW